MDQALQIELYHQIGHYLHKIRVDENILEDIRQDIFLKVHDAIHTVKDNTKIVSWLQVIAYNAVMDHHRKINRQAPSPVITDEVRNEGNETLIKCISLLIQTLPDEQKAAMEAIEINGLSQVEYAQQHNLPLSTVKSRIQRARKKIKETVETSCLLRTDKFGNVTDYVPPKEIL